MRIVVFFFIILIAGFYIGGQISQVKNIYVIYYSSWAVGLIFANSLIGLFLYTFRHSVLNTSGQPGLKGKMGRRGEEGESEFCNFCLPKTELEKMNEYPTQPVVG
jgi:hypothetical protein